MFLVSRKQLHIFDKDVVPQNKNICDSEEVEKKVQKEPSTAKRLILNYRKEIRNGRSKQGSCCFKRTQDSIL